MFWPLKSILSYNTGIQAFIIHMMKEELSRERVVRECVNSLGLWIEQVHYELQKVEFIVMSL